ncbi:MAG: R3H domain-containing nucleic acid-binding protein [Chloroflexota bacterium]|nr:R3H domain-containing nucleic acid-binding protein [Chloroflexota bacterium]
MYKVVTDDLDVLLAVFPDYIAKPLLQKENRSEFLEVVMDLGRPPEARFLNEEVTLSPQEVSDDDIDYVVSRISAFGDDNRAGIERTLHRISAIRNRKGRIVGLSCRVGRAVFGTITLIRDLVESGQSILLLGRPGVGKTTMLREVARVLADDLRKRVIIVDTSNEIGGDGDIPHPAIGRARRMQVPTPLMQHAVMIEAVENHMPEVIVIDEIGTELEAQAARTIAERGVQLVGTAHGNTLDNLMMNPTLSDLIGGIQQVTLGDEEARRRGTQKSILERRAPPTFDVVVEIQNWERVAIHSDVAAIVDATLRGHLIPLEVRWFEDGEIKSESVMPFAAIEPSVTKRINKGDEPQRILPFGINRARLEESIRRMRLPVAVVSNLDEADLLMTSKNQYRRQSQVLRDAEIRGIPIYVIGSDKASQMEIGLANIYRIEESSDSVALALKETEEAIEEILRSGEMVELNPQNAFIRRLQHQLAEKHDLATRSTGKPPRRRVRIYTNNEDSPE